jgi:hypothetical protein
VIYLEYLTEQPANDRETQLVHEARVQGAKLFAATLARLGILPIGEDEADAVCAHINTAARIVLESEEEGENALLHRVTVREVSGREEGATTHQE